MRHPFAIYKVDKNKRKASYKSNTSWKIEEYYKNVRANNNDKSWCKDEFSVFFPWQFIRSLRW